MSEENAPLIPENEVHLRSGSDEALPGTDDENCSEARNQSPKWRKVIGMACAIASAVIYSTISFSVKNWKVNPTDMLSVRAPIQTIGAAIYIKIKAGQFWPTRSEDEVFDDRRWLLPLSILLYSFCVGWTNLGGLTSITMIPLGDAITLIFMAPLFTAIMARIFREMPIRGFKIFFIILLIAGAVFIVQPPFIFGVAAASDSDIVHDLWYFMGVFVALSVAISLSTINNLLAVPLKNVAPRILLFYVGIIFFLIALVSSRLDKHSRMISPDIGEITIVEWITLLSIVFGDMVALYCTIKAFQLADTVVIVVLKCLEIPISYMAQIYAMNQVPNALGAIGAVLVMTSVVIIPCENLILKTIPETFLLKKYL